MYRLFKVWLYLKVIFEILGRIKGFIAKLLKRRIKNNIFSEDNVLKRNNEQEQ